MPTILLEEDGGASGLGDPSLIHGGVMKLPSLSLSLSRRGPTAIERRANEQRKTQFVFISLILCSVLAFSAAAERTGLAMARLIIFKEPVQ